MRIALLLASVLFAFIGATPGLVGSSPTSATRYLAASPAQAGSTNTAPQLSSPNRQALDAQGTYCSMDALVTNPLSTNQSATSYSAYYGQPDHQDPSSNAELKIILARRLTACHAILKGTSLFAKNSVYVQYGIPIPAAGCAPVSGTLLSLYDQLDGCVNYLTLVQGISLPTPFIASRIPTLFIIMDSTPATAASGAGAPPPSSSSPSGQKSPSGAQNQQAANSPSSTQAPAASGSNGTGTGTIDNPSQLLLYDLAIRLSPPSQPHLRTLVVPAPLWTMTNFYNQCLADPFRLESGAEIGTLGALVVNESTVTNSGSFALVAMNGWTRVKLSVTYYRCYNVATNSGNGVPLPTQLVWHTYAEGKNYRNGISFLPFATYLTYLSTKWTGSTTLPNQNGETVANTSAADYVLAFALPGLTSVTVGDTSLTMTVPRAYDDVSAQLLASFDSDYCARIAAAAQQDDNDSALCDVVADAGLTPPRFYTLAESGSRCYSSDAVVWVPTETQVLGGIYFSGELVSRAQQQRSDSANQRFLVGAWMCKATADSAGVLDFATLPLERKQRLVSPNGMLPSFVI